MDMVSHEDVGMDSAVVTFRCFFGALQIKAEIIIGEEGWIPVAPTLDDVLGLSGKNVARQGAIDAILCMTANS